MHRIVVATALLTALSGCQAATPPAAPVAQRDGFEVLATIDVGSAPHGIRFGADGETAYVALSGDDQVAVVDLASMEVVDKLDAGTTPLDLIALESGGWAVTQFRSDELISLGAAGEPRSWAVGKSPSLFSATTVDGVAALVSEFADELTLFDTRTEQITATYPTGKQPYPGEITSDGVLAFIPNRGAGSVSVIDLLSGKTVAETPVCENPEGGALTVDEVSYIVACGGSDELAYVNTASFEVTARVSGLGPRPFSVAATPDGRFGIVNNAGGTSVSILDIATATIIEEIPAGDKPIVVRVHPDGHRALVSSEDSGTVTVIGLPIAAPVARGEALTELVVFGMIHGSHRTSERYGVDVLREAIRSVDPDYVLVEIPPNRFDRAATEFATSGQIAEERVLRFPEYIDVLFPLTAELDFEIIPTAGWNRHMSDYRAEVLRAASADPARAAEWTEYQSAGTASQAALQAGGASDDPRWIHTDEYDAAQEISLSVYNRLFNDEIGPGGWENINRAHYANIAAALDRVAGEGKRVLITYGAGHKGWFLRHLRQRTDVDLIDARQFFPQ